MGHSRFTTRAMRIKKVTKIAIIGAGHVGAVTAFALILKELADEIVLIDINSRRSEGEAVDLTNAAMLNDQPDVYTGTFEDLRDASIVIITAGHAPKLGETDQATLEANLKILNNVAPKIGKLAPRSLLIVAGHPNEALTYAAAKLSGLPEHHVIGYGTSLESTLFRCELAKHYSVDPRDVYASVVGQHGIAEMPLWSTIAIGKDYEDDEVFACFWKAKQAAFSAIDHKGHPSFTMAAGIVAIVEAILRDENTLMTVAVPGHYLGVSDIALSVPTRLSRAGAKQMPGCSDDWAEEDSLKSCAQDVKDQIEAMELPTMAVERPVEKVQASESNS
ncbi:hypothetical protein LTR95_004407, partial [Oleoguttula sp. CCFEE 5521]